MANENLGSNKTLLCVQRAGLRVVHFAIRHSRVFFESNMLLKDSNNENQFLVSKKQKQKPTKYELGGGFKSFLFSPLPGEMIQFDQCFSNGLKPPTR